MANFEAEEKKYRRTKKRGSGYVRFLKSFAAFMVLLWVLSELEDGGSPLDWKALIVVPVLAALYLTYMYRRLYYDAIVLRRTHARLVDKFQAFHVHNVVEEICVAAGLERPRIAVIDDPALNAFSISMRNTERNVVVFTTGLIDTLTRDELQGVAAHELAQMVNRSENYFHADAAAVRLTRNPSGLRRALEKIASGTGAVRASPRNVRHLWFADPEYGARNRAPGVDPLRMGGSRFVRRQDIDPYVDPHAHPPLQERIEVLRRLDGLGPAPAAPIPSAASLPAGEVLPRTPEVSAALTRRRVTRPSRGPILLLLFLLLTLRMAADTPWLVVGVLLLFVTSKHARKMVRRFRGVAPDHAGGGTHGGHPVGR